MTRTTILHIAPTPFFADRGCHIRIRNEIAALERQPLKIILCTYHHGSDIQGIDIRRIPRIPGYTKLDAGYSPFRFLADLLLFFLALKVAWQENPKLLHAHLHEGTLIGWAVKTLLFWRRMPLIMDMQGSLSGELAAYGTFKKMPLILHLIHLVEWLICRLPDHIFCSSDACRESLLQEFKINPVKIELLYDVVPDVFFHLPEKKEMRFNYKISQDKTVLIYTGSLLQGKGIDHVFESMVLLASKHPDFHWILVGYPVEEAAAFLQRHDLIQVCTLVGRVAYDQLARWLAVADIALEPKESESAEASGKVLHYMAAALPVVCFATDNNRQLLADTAYYAISGNGQSFAECIVSAAQNRKEGKAWGASARRRVSSSHSLSTIEGQLEQVYRKKC